jgi:hypothetical protein
MCASPINPITLEEGIGYKEIDHGQLIVNRNFLSSRFYDDKKSVLEELGLLYRLFSFIMKN